MLNNYIFLIIKYSVGEEDSNNTKIFPILKEDFIEFKNNIIGLINSFNESELYLTNIHTLLKEKGVYLLDNIEDEELFLQVVLGKQLFSEELVDATKRYMEEEDIVIDNSFFRTVFNKKVKELEEAVHRAYLKMINDFNSL